jgi:Domain of unknown function (DUF1942)
MKIGTGIMAAAASAAIAAAGIIGAPAASADPQVAKFGAWQKLQDSNGGAVTISAWGIADLRPSSDTIPSYPLEGKLWEANAGFKAIQGSGTPIIPNLNARAANGQNYQVLWQAATPNGISGATLQQGASSRGKIYFDVTGASPTTVAYYNGAQDLLLWQ